ncbi:MAG: hypothetical protein ACI8QZ_000375 [Chlamydiales bacterium]|jgi:hypothetical protein
MAFLVFLIAGLLAGNIASAGTGIGGLPPAKKKALDRPGGDRPESGVTEHP